MLPYRKNYLYRTTLLDAAYAGQSGFYPNYTLYGLSKYGFATCGSTVLYNLGAGLCDDGFAYEFDNQGTLDKVYQVRELVMQFGQLVVMDFIWINMVLSQMLMIDTTFHLFIPINLAIL